MRKLFKTMDLSDPAVLVKLCVFLAMAICSFATGGYNMIGTGIDPSWRYAINLDLNWGTDVILTYGPLGYLFWPQNVNNHLVIASIIMGLIYAYLLWMLWQFFFSEKSPLTKNRLLLIAGAISYCVSAVVIDVEKLITFVILFSILMAYKIDRRYNIGGCILLLLSFYVKTSLTIEALSAYAVFILMLWFWNHKDKARYTIELLVTILLFPITFLAFYNHSADVLGKYVYGMLQMSSGYSAAMSGDWQDIYMVWIVLIMICYFGCCGIMIAKKSEDAPLAMLLLGPLFFAYKHGFVRADSIHIMHSFPVLLVYLAPYLMAWDLTFLKQEHEGKNRLAHIYTVGVSVIFVTSFLFVQGSAEDFVKNLKMRTLDFPSRIEDMVNQDRKNTLYVLPKEVYDIVQQDTVCIYPWELSYIASNDLNFEIMPAFQAYSAYTPYLDELCAEYFTAEDSPNFILLSSVATDDRWPFHECPQTWTAISNNYKFVAKYENIFVMRKNFRHKEHNYELTSTTAMDKKAWLEVEGNEKRIYKLDAELTLWGKIVSLFWKIPEVNLTVAYENGVVGTKRILLDNLAGGANLSHMFTDEVMFQLYLEGTDPGCSLVDKIQLCGDGLKYYKDEIAIEIYDKMD